MSESNGEAMSEMTYLIPIDEHVIIKEGLFDELKQQLRDDGYKDSEIEVVMDEVTLVGKAIRVTGTKGDNDGS